MPLKIKSNYGAADHEQQYIVSWALQAGGQVLNGATELSEHGTYIALPSAMDLDGADFILKDNWFHGAPQNTDTVTGAVEEATGIRFSFAPPVASEPAVISSYEIVNRDKYDATVGKQVELIAHKEDGLNFRGSYSVASKGDDSELESEGDERMSRPRL